MLSRAVSGTPTDEIVGSTWRNCIQANSVFSNLLPVIFRKVGIPPIYFLFSFWYHLATYHTIRLLRAWSVRQGNIPFWFIYLRPRKLPCCRPLQLSHCCSRVRHSPVVYLWEWFCSGSPPRPPRFRRLSRAPGDFGDEVRAFDCSQLLDNNKEQQTP